MKFVFIILRSKFLTANSVTLSVRVFCDTRTKRIYPVRYGYSERPLDLGLVQYGEGGTFYGTGELVAVAGLDVALGLAAVLCYHFGEIVPAADALVGIIEN